jgi:leader peptidase (prepilin peptidase)/N-methyltransferase
LNIIETFTLIEFPWKTFFGVLSFCIGACVGSFLNVCIYRIPRELSVVVPRSFCPSCKTPIKWYDNIPLLSFLILQGRCRQCNAPINIRYLIVEFLTALLFLMVWLKYDFSPGSRPLMLSAITHLGVVFVYWTVVSGLILGSFVDFEHLIIPDRVTLGGIVFGIISSAVIPELHGEKSPVWSLIWSGWGAIAGVGILWGVAVIGRFIFKKEAMGFGDVKLLGAIGAIFGGNAVLFTLFVSSLIGSIVGITLVSLHKKKMQSKIPYGPYIALAAIIWMLWGTEITHAYKSLIYPQENEQDIPPVLFHY